MTEEPDNIVLRYLRRIDARMEDLFSTADEIKSRLRSIEDQVSLLRTDTAAIYSNIVRLDRRIDGLENRFKRVEIRLGVIEA
jgi:polyhydroxyalkanoate synthesis regulator phasin